MRVVIVNLHCNDFLVRHLGRIMSNNKVKSFKHQFVLRGLLNNNIEVVNLITNEGTRALFPYSYLTRRIRFARILESFFVECKNSLPIIGTISEKDIKKDDIIVGYLVFPDTMSIIFKADCYKVVFGNHFVSINNPIDLGQIGVNAFVNEIDLSNNEFVKKYINPGNSDHLKLPYVFAPRFRAKKGFKERINKVMAVGTASTCEGAPGYSLYKEFFNTEKIQLMRWEILERKDEIKEYVDCFIGDIRSGSVKKRVPQGVIDKVIWKFQSRKAQNQSDYTSFDMVETFNNYKMFVCPEELVGMPGIGAIEGMACGTAYIGIDHEMYKSLGLVPDVHYITYDGTLGGLIDVIKEYQNRPDDVERIAKTGMEYVREHFNEKAIQESFISQLTNSYERYLDQQNND